MRYYQKGVRAELEWVKFLNYRGFGSVRSAASGNALYPVDVVAIRKGLVLAFEVKNYAKLPRLDKEQAGAMKGWCDKTGAFGFLAWRSKNGWLFLRLQDAVDGNYKNERWITMPSLLAAFGI
ncbi:MAG: hypothetical protein HY519_01225 [Candidatus Aenigmarchaeota archaeon]|nr:hypothetical protein [Candidatus Aenigmarchaeota archaeon]